MGARIAELSQETRVGLRAADEGRQDEFARLDLGLADRSFALVKGGLARGWYSLWLKGAPQYQRYRTAALGHFYADSPETALALLAHGREQALAAGMGYLLGPLDGSTWRGYRLTTDDYGCPPFFLDRLTPLFWAECFVGAGFSRIAEYFSTKSAHLAYEEPAAPVWLERIRAGQCVLRPLNMDAFEDDLREMYELSRISFASNFLYTPIGLPEFLAMYRPLGKYIRPEFVQLAHMEGRLAGFCLCLPDYAQQERGRAIESLILKTVARDPAPDCKGLGAFLFWNSHRLAAEHGFHALITAFMHSENASLHLARKAGKPIRSYALYGREL